MGRKTVFCFLETPFPICSPILEMRVERRNENISFPGVENEPATAAHSTLRC